MVYLTDKPLATFLFLPLILLKEQNCNAKKKCMPSTRPFVKKLKKRYANPLLIRMLRIWKE